MYRHPANVLVIIAAIALIVPSGCDAVIDVELRVEDYDGPDLSADDVDGLWSADVAAPTVTLTLGPTHINRDSMAIVMTLEDVPGALPSLEDIWHGPLGGGVGTRIRKATVEVHSWDLDHLISGVVNARLPNGLRMRSTFWVEVADD